MTMATVAMDATQPVIFLWFGCIHFFRRTVCKLHRSISIQLKEISAHEKLL